MLCGNTNIEEIEQASLFTDEEGNDGEFPEWFCKEGLGCCK